MGYNSRMFKVLTPPQFDKWLDGLRDPVGSAAINLRIERAKLGNLGQWRAVGDGVNEMKIDVGPGYRAYFVRRGQVDAEEGHQASEANRWRTGGLSMKISELAEFDGSKYLKDEETIRHYLAQAFEDGNPRLIQAALGNVAKARGMTALARESGVKREALYRALSEGGNAEFATIMKVVGALGLHLTVAPAEPAPVPAPATTRARSRVRTAAHA
ncbi:hypothetical protein BMMON3_04270 [Burkholderia mallei]